MGKEALLIHGWSTGLYTKKEERQPADAGWKKDAAFINLLKRHFDVQYHNLPGFCGEREPDNDFFDIEDFSTDLKNRLKQKKRLPSMIIGYSFGGVVALDHKVRYASPIPLVLIAPALFRKESIFSKLAHLVAESAPGESIRTFKNFYQTLFSRYYREATPFLRQSYDVVARRNTTGLLGKVDPSEILLIYGNRDNDTPWQDVEKIVGRRGLSYFLISEGGHNVIKTHPRQIVEQIVKFEKRY